MEENPNKVATILVTEDNPASLKLATVLLTKAGHRVVQAIDGAAALAAAREHRPDLILMDVQMAGMDGLEATRHLKADPATAGIPVVALTAFAMRGDEEKMLSAGCDGYIAKPYRYEEFLRKVRGYLGED